MVKNKVFNKSVKANSEAVLPKIWNRGKLIEPMMVGGLFQVHSGKVFITIKVSSVMVGYKLGHFVWTRKARVEHKRKN